MIVDGKIKLKSAGPIKKFTKTGMVFEDGSELPADVVLFATGYGDPRGPIRDIVGPEVGKKLTPVWGIDDEGELRSCWKEIGVENLWLMMGTSCRRRSLKGLVLTDVIGNFAWCRFYSKRLALRECRRVFLRLIFYSPPMQRSRQSRRVSSARGTLRLSSGELVWWGFYGCNRPCVQ